MANSFFVDNKEEKIEFLLARYLPRLAGKKNLKITQEFQAYLSSLPDNNRADAGKLAQICDSLDRLFLIRLERAWEFYVKRIEEKKKTDNS